MSNQGLEALAALASAVSPSGGGGTSNSNSSSQQGASSSGSGGENRLGAANGVSSAVQPAILNSTTAGLVPPIAGISPQQWQQAVSAAAAGISALSGTPNLSMLAGVPGQVNPAGNPAALLAFQQQLAMQQQMNYYQLLAQTQRQAGNQSILSAPLTAQAGANLIDANGQGMSFGNAQAALLPSHVPTDSNNAANSNNAFSNNVNISSMPAAQAASQAISVSTVGIPSPPQHHAAIAPQPSQKPSSHSMGDSFGGGDSYEDFDEHGDKRQLKRVANRRSAQLSRKRKKQFIEELKDENDGLRRKEQILKSIPDLIVVFDSSGKLWFVSESVSRFLDFTVEELEGTSFWNRLCEDSIRLLKAAFMDSLAARHAESETAPLGAGFWKLRLVDKDGTQKVVTLNGVVHFAGDRPECVCSIRPHEESKTEGGSRRKDISRDSSLVSYHQSLVRIKPQQSVVGGTNDRNESLSSRQVGGSEAVRISDSGNSSNSSSDSGSGDEQNIDVAA